MIGPMSDKRRDSRSTSASPASDLDVLEHAPLFDGLTAEEWSRCRTLLHRTNIRAGAHLFTAEQPGDVAYIIISGSLKVLVEQSDGSDVILAILGSGDVVGEMGVVENAGRSASVVAQEDSGLAWLDRAGLWTCLREMPTLSLNLIRMLAGRLRMANAQVQALSGLDVYGRVARQILAFADIYGTTLTSGTTVIPLRLTQTDLSGMVGASRMRVNQVMVAFKKRHYISVDRRYHITVHDRSALEQRIR